jgi:hypothetical protein
MRALSLWLLTFLVMASLSHGEEAAAPANALHVIQPYRVAGTWAFDDPRVGLRQEPFVLGIPAMLDDLAKGIPEADKGFRLIFAGSAFPGYSHEFHWRRAERGGHWYYSPKLKTEGWLCPAMFKYFPAAPKVIYAKAEPMAAPAP